MLKIQELRLDDTTFYIREPRLRDYLKAKAADKDEYSFYLMAGMMLDADKKEVGLEFIYDLPLRHVETVNKVIEDFTKAEGEVPLIQSDDSSTDSPSA